MKKYFFIILFIIMNYLYYKKYKKYKEKYTNLKSNNNLLIIPHAGKKYSGPTRLNAFKQTNKNCKQIFYIAAIHNMFSAKQNIKNNICIVNDNLNIFNDTIFLKKFNENQKKIIDTEHSFKWVEEELRDYYTNAKITVIYPTSYSPLNKIYNVLKDYLNNNDYLIIGTSDFIHYGDRFNITDWKFPQERKILEEGKFINHICNHHTREMENDYNNKPYLCCGFTSIKAISLLAKNSNKNGVVVDYHDSDQSQYNDIRRYSISNDKINSFVSYASIVFKNIQQNKISEMDIKLSLGAVRSIINHSIKNTNFNNFTSKNFIPIFSYLHKMKNGIFVGTKHNNKTNSSYGNYQSTNSSAADNLFNASQSCYSDSVNRWRIPITQDINENTYKVELLQDKNNWKEIKSTDLNSSHYSLGLYLTVNFDNNSYSATYLPGVWEEHFSDDPNEVLKSLTKKATGNRYENWSQDKTSTVKLYNSKKYSSTDFNYN